MSSAKQRSKVCYTFPLTPCKSLHIARYINDYIHSSLCSNVCKHVCTNCKQAFYAKAGAALATGDGQGEAGKVRKAAQQKFKKKKTVQIKLFAFVGFASLAPSPYLPPLPFLLWQKSLPRVNAKFSVASGKWQAQN